MPNSGETFGSTTGNIGTAAATAIHGTSWTFANPNAGTFIELKTDTMSDGEHESYTTDNTFTLTSPDANMGTHTFTIKVFLDYANEEEDDNDEEFDQE